MCVCLTSSFILTLGPLSSAVSSSGQSVCFFSLSSPAISSFLPSSFFFLFVPANPDAPESFRSLATCVFRPAAGLHRALGLGSLGNLGDLGCFGAFGSFVLAVLLAGAFNPPVALSLAVLLGALGFGSGGLHSSLSSSLLAVWEKDLMAENQFAVVA